MLMPKGLSASAKFNRVNASVFVVLVAALFGLGRAVAQQQPNPTTGSLSAQVPNALPVTPPPGWKTSDWLQLRQFCLGLAEKHAAGIPLNDNEFWSSASCRSAAWAIARDREQAPSSASTIGATPAPRSLPTPVSNFQKSLRF